MRFEPNQQHGFSVGLREHQRVRISAGQIAEVDREQRPAAVPHAKDGHLDSASQQFRHETQRLECLERASMYDASPGRVLACRLTVDDHMRHAGPSQLQRKSQAGWPGADEQDIG